MNVQHTFFLPVTPKATQRSRCTCRGKFAQVYTDPKYKEWREEALPLLREIVQTEDFRAVQGQPISIDVEAVFPKPKTTKRDYPRGDLDNVEKGLWDAITAAGSWWVDDDQIIESRTRKRWTKPDEQPGYYVTIRFLS